MRCNTLISLFGLLSISAIATVSKPWSSTANHLYDAMTAQFLDHRGDYTRAMKTMAKIADESHEQAAYRFAYALAIDALDFKEAEQLAHDWHMSFPHDAEAQWALLRVFLTTNRVDTAYDLLCEMLKKNGSPHQVAQISRYLTYLEDADARLKLLEKLSRRFANNPFLDYYVGLMAKEQGQISLAVEAFDRALALDGNWRELRLMQAEALASIGRLQSAKKLMDGLIAEDTRNEELYSAYIDILVDQNQWDDAIKMINAWLSLGPSVETSEIIRRQQGWLASRAGHIDQALSIYHQLLEDDAIDYNQFLFDTANALRDAGLERQAQAMFAQISDESVLYIISQEQIAISDYEMGNIIEGEQRFAAFRQAFPDYALESYLIEIARLDVHQQWQSGDRVLQEALAEYPEQSDLLYAKAEHFVAQGLNNEAIKAYADLLAHDPANIDALNAYGYLLLTKTDRLSEGAKMIRAALDAYPDAPAIQDSFAWLNYLQGNLEEALLWSRRAYAAYRQGEIVPHYIQILRANGEYDLAREVYENERREQINNPAFVELKTQMERVDG